MNQAWVLLWLANEPATATQQQQMHAWAESKQVELTAPVHERTGQRDDRRASGAIVAHIESLLSRGRIATAALDAAALDAAAAEALIAEAVQRLRAHPELPQAPWLLAEALSIEADLAFAVGDPTRAELRRRAAARLEGARSITAGATQSPLGSFDEQPFDEQPFDEQPFDEQAAPAQHLRELEIEGLRPGDQLVWDGHATPAEASGSLRLSTRGGLHHGRVLRGGQAVWSGWVELRSLIELRSLSEGESSEGLPSEGALERLLLPVPAPAPCSSEDLSPMLAHHPAGTAVACDRWVAARPATARGAPATAASATAASTPEQAAIELAFCHRNQCGPFERWPRAAAPPGALVPAPAADGAGASFWSYALLGTAAAAAATIIILSVTQRSQEERPVWVYGGVE